MLRQRGGAPAAGRLFVIEVGMPDLRRLPPGERYVVFDVADRHVGFDEYDVANQGLISHHFESVRTAAGIARPGRSATSGPRRWT